MGNSAKLTDAGRKMILRYIEHERHVRSTNSLRPYYTARDGRIFMTLSPGNGAAAMTVRKLVRDGYAEGTFNWGSQARWMIPTEKGLAAVGEPK